jgi:hypothetical protein
MRLFKRETLSKLNTLIVQTISDFGEKPLTNADAVTAALPKARKILIDEFDAVVCATIRPMVQAALAKGVAPAYAHTPVLLPGIDLPYRIAVPGTYVEDDDEQGGIAWIVLHKATLGELRRHVAMRQGLIDGAQQELGRCWRS